MNPDGDDAVVTSVDSLERQAVVLANGASIRLRPIVPADASRLLALCQRSSPHTVYERFFSSRRLRPEDARALANVDYRRRMALVAEIDGGAEPEVIGVARYAPSGEGDIADIALVVEDRWQGLGLGSILIDELLRAGERRGITRFSADVLTENGRALRLLARHVDVIDRTTSDGVTSLVFRRRPDPLLGVAATSGDRVGVQTVGLGGA